VFIKIRNHDEFRAVALRKSQHFPFFLSYFYSRAMSGDIFVVIT
jgi:hypothetical protein